jgi:hypothetical protein
MAIGEPNDPDLRPGGPPVDPRTMQNLSEILENIRQAAQLLVDLVDELRRFWRL